MRTISLYRLMAVLMMPEEASSVILRPKAHANIHDMENWRRWYNNIISINKDLAWVIKPDYTCFHHHAFYGSAYGPHVLHKAALIHYLTNGTIFGNLFKPVGLPRQGKCEKRSGSIQSSQCKVFNPQRHWRKISRLLQWNNWQVSAGVCVLCCVCSNDTGILF